MEKKGCLEILIFSLALMVGGVGTLTAQDSKPADKKPADKKAADKTPGAKKAKSSKFIYLNVRGENYITKVEKINLADDKASDFLADPEGKTRYTLFKVSPNGKIGVVFVEGGGVKEHAALYDMSTGKAIDTQIPKVPAFFCFIDNEKLVYIEKIRGAKDGDPKTRVIQTDVKGTTRNVLHQSEDSFWDDIPLSLTPDKKHVIYFARDKDYKKKGLVMVSLKDGTTQMMPEGLTFCQWSSDGKRLFAFSKKKKSFLRYDYDGKGGFTNEKSLGELVLFLRNLGKDSFLGMRADMKERKTKLAVMDKSAKVIFELTDKVVKGDETIYQPAAFDADTNSFYFIEYERQDDLRLYRLMEATIKEGKVASRRVVKVSEERMSMPFLGR